MRRRAACDRKLVIGVTGSFGSGKSTVARMLEAEGAELIDADRIAHRLLSSKTRAYRRIVSVFGTRILNRDTAINREKLAEIVFDNKTLLRQLNQIIHPDVIRTIKKKIGLSSKRVVVLDAPLLVEADSISLVDVVVVVYANRATQIKRVRARSTFTNEQIIKRIRAQAPLKEKARLADFVIDNNATLAETRKQVEKYWETLQ